MKVLYSTPESLYVMGKFDKEGVSRYIDEAEQMGAKMIKLILGDYSGISSEDEEALKETLGKHEITLMVENDQSKAGGTLQRLLPFLNLCKEKEIKIFSTFDIGNWLWTGENPLINAMELEMFTKYIHLKDIIIENSVPNTTYLNEGSINWKEVLNIFSSDIPVALEYPCGAEAEKVLKEEVKKLFQIFGIIKDKIHNVSVENALEHIIGVTPFNDVTERIMGFDQELLTYCKSFDTFSSFGPVIDTQINPDDTIVRTYLNGEKVQEGFTKDMVFNCSQIVSYVSKCMTLYPGDIISTGTPVHVLPMKDGDKVEIEINGIEDRLTNFVYDPKVH